MMASASVQPPGDPNIHEHREPEKPLVYEPPDLHGRKHVEKIATEYRVREDECLADKLQNEEFELHFGKNKLDNKILHMDVKTAKEIYLREVEESGMLSKDELANLCKDDAFIAEEIEKRVNENKDLEAQTKTALEMQDEEFAIYLQAKEKQKLDEERKERLQRRIQQDRAAAERLQRRLDSQVEEEEEALRKGVSDIQIRKAEWAVECEVGSHPPKSAVDLKAIKSSQSEGEKRLQELEMEQRRLEEERDRKIAIKLQRAEAEEYQRAKREREFRRAQTERRREDPTSDRRKQYVDSHGKPRSSTPPERRRQANSLDRIDSPSRSQHRVEGAGRLVRTDSPMRYVENNKKVLQSVDASGKPVHDPANLNMKDVRNKTPRKPANPPEEGIYLTAVDAIGAVKSINNEASPQNTQSTRTRAYSDNTKRGVPTNKKVPSTPTDSRDAQILPGDAFALSDDQKSHHTSNGTSHRNIAADIDPTYSTINHFSQQQLKRDVEIRPAPVVQNVKRTSSNDGEKKKKKWFSKK